MSFGKTILLINDCQDRESSSMDEATRLLELCRQRSKFPVTRLIHGFLLDQIQMRTTFRIAESISSLASAGSSRVSRALKQAVNWLQSSLGFSSNTPAKTPVTR